MNEKIKQASEIIKKANRVTAFTGAGISVESGIPPFRGKGGLWNKFNPKILDLDYFKQNPNDAWKLIKELFYDFMGKTNPNKAHICLAEMEKAGYIHSVITQNIDNLHQIAGSKEVYEFHGNSRNLVCLDCNEVYPVKDLDLNNLPPRCKKCNSVLKPDFVFFGEPIPKEAYDKSFAEVENADVFIVVGTTGEIMPASLIPVQAKGNGKKIIEINVEPSNYTEKITDVFLQGKASEMMTLLWEEIKK